ncbi:HK97 family phage prohead protease [Qipengyuania sp. JC766]|uniref:HK97 family phage prohead protease n=1 Tax=Qipengyuania sp. JC766 TaxID=3232139 RepID=UPI003458BE4C
MKLAGYAALFGRPDGARDTIRAGAFALSLAGRTGPLPLFWQHRSDRRIGWVEQAAEDARGLRIVATLDNPDGRPARMLAARAISGLSFGYRARRASHHPQGRTLEEIDLFEVSLVTHPLQHGARVHLVLPAPPPGCEVLAHTA